jgi:predicted nucleic acid-binding protein
VPVAVVDACVAVAWAMPDEQAGPEAELLRAHQERRIGLLAPSIWEYEVANALRMAVLRGRVTPGFGSGLLAVLLGMGIVVTGFTDLADRVWELSVSRAIAVYDASYIALAETRGCDLYTCDQQLATAAGEFVGVHLICPR